MRLLKDTHTFLKRRNYFLELASRKLLHAKRVECHPHYWVILSEVLLPYL